MVKKRGLTSILDRVDVGQKDAIPPAPGDLARSVLEPAKGSRVVPPTAQADLMRRSRPQTYNLVLPVSKREATCSHMLLAPEQCIVPTFNRRVQSLLSIEDPSMAQLIDSMRAEGQREPVLARAIRENNQVVRYELIWGSRRRFAAEALSRESGAEEGFPLRAWVSSDIPDIDAARLSRTENEDREDISAWEMAIYLARIQKENPEWSHDVIAQQEGVDRSLVSLYLTMASIPEPLIKMVISPKEIKLRSGIGLAKLWAGIEPAVREKVRIAISDKVPYSDDKSLTKAIRNYLPFVKSDSLRVPQRGKIVMASATGDTSVSIGKHRSKPGTYSLDLEGISDAQMEALTQWFQKELKVK